MKPRMTLLVIAMLTTCCGGCAGWGSWANIPPETRVVKKAQQLDIRIIVARPGAITDPARELVPPLFSELPKVLKAQGGFVGVTTIEDGKPEVSAGTRVILLTTNINKTSNAAVPTVFMTKINFTHSSAADYSAFDVTNVQPGTRFDEGLQAKVDDYDMAQATRLFRGSVSTDQRGDYAAQTDIPKFVEGMLGVAAHDLSVKMLQAAFRRFV